jgi:hypothetical protein
LANREISQFLYKERRHMPGSPTTPGRSGTHVNAPVRIAFRFEKSVGTQIDVIFAAQWLAYAIPYRRFADTLAEANARLGADVGRYPFIVVDLYGAFRVKL